MFRQSAARQRRTSRLTLVGGLIALVGVAAGATALPEVGPAHPPASAVPLSSWMPDAGEPPPPDPADPAADEVAEAATFAARPSGEPVAAPAAAGHRPDPDRRENFSRSLVYSGTLGLLLSLAGLTLVSRRRQLW